MEDPDRPGDHACPHTLVTSIPDGIHKHKHTHNVNRRLEAKEGRIGGKGAHAHVPIDIRLDRSTLYLDIPVSEAMAVLRSRTLGA